LTTVIYTLSLHDALPIFSILEHLMTRASAQVIAAPIDWDRFLERHQGIARTPLLTHIVDGQGLSPSGQVQAGTGSFLEPVPRNRSEEHTSELQSRVDLVC